MNKMTKPRLKYLLYEALKWIEEECADFFCCEVDDEYEWFEDAIGIHKEELHELDITLNHGNICADCLKKLMSYHVLKQLGLIKNIKGD